MKIQITTLSEHTADLPAAVTMAQEFGERFFFNIAGTITKLP